MTGLAKEYTGIGDDWDIYHCSSGDSLNPSPKKVAGTFAGQMSGHDRMFGGEW